jgi:hypothetical protein
MNSNLDFAVIGRKSWATAIDEMLRKNQTKTDEKIQMRLAKAES